MAPLPRPRVSSLLVTVGSSVLLKCREREGVGSGRHIGDHQKRKQWPGQGGQPVLMGPVLYCDLALASRSLPQLVSAALERESRQRWVTKWTCLGAGTA